MRSKIALWCLKLAGIFMIICGFLYRNLEHFPILYRKVCPQCAHADVGLQAIRDGEITATNEGFAELAGIYLNQIYPTSAAVKPYGPAKVAVIAAQGGAFINNIDLSRTIRVVTKLPAGFRGTDSVEFDVFKAAVERLKQRQLFRVGTTLVVFGVLIELLALGIDVFSFFNPSSQYKIKDGAVAARRDQEKHSRQDSAGQKENQHESSPSRDPDDWD